jgi:predicted nucleic acid-binding protein
MADASFALKWIEREPCSDEASELLEKCQKQRRRLTAPALFAYEATNALAKRVKRGQVSLEIARERLAFLLENGPALENDVAVNLRALEITERFSLPSDCDAHYLALAESLQCECWTADERLWNTARNELPWVRWVGQRTSAIME